MFRDKATWYIRHIRSNLAPCMVKIWLTMPSSSLPINAFHRHQAQRVRSSGPQVRRQSPSSAQLQADRRSAEFSMTNCKAQVAAALDRASGLPSLVVFDLDYTLWPFWCEIKEATDTPHLYPEARQVLDALRDKGVRMAVASRTPTPPVASAFLQKLGISSGYFDSVQLIPWTSANAQKDKAHFPKIQKETGIPYSEMLFFDDESPNIARVSKLGVISFLVSEAEGVSCRSFTQALQQYDNSHK